MQSETRHIITALEVLPVFIVWTLWADRLLNRRTFVFIDNDGARHSLLKAYSRSVTIRRVLRNIVGINARQPAYLWYGRVPTDSNLSDGPSRGRKEELLRAGATEDVVADAVWAAAVE